MFWLYGYSCCMFFVMIRRPPRSTRTDTLFPYTTLFRSAPFYAVKINPGDATTTLGLRVDARARVLDAKGKVIAGLYACGLDMNSLWRGVPPANGANNTLSLTFGYIAGRDLSGANAPA